MRPIGSYFIDFLTLVPMAVVQFLMARAVWRWARARGWGEGTMLGLAVLLETWAALLALGASFSTPALTMHLALPAHAVGVIQAITSLWLFASSGSYVVYRIWRRWARGTAEDIADTGRRRALQSIGYAAIAAPAAAIGYGALIGRTDFHVVEREIAVPGLHPDLENLRILQVSDFHLSAFLSEKELARAIDAANELKPHIALMTGDLVTRAGDPVATAVRQTVRLKADAGVYGCMGNHEIYAGSEDLTQRLAARSGAQFLRMENRVLKFGQGQFNLAGVDYQRAGHKELYLAGAEKLIVPGMPNFLMSHNPDVFPVAARKGFDVTFAGHTHGGQVTVEILDQSVNPARFYTRYVTGLYRIGERSCYVTRGIGTIGLPARIGATPEITLIRLKRA
ncbi:MAG TPA: hypothetical protein DEQ47_05435 [Solibacterales bacterium]|nr:hypothetical protein [Bryobacterales bacterium]